MGQVGIPTQGYHTAQRPLHLQPQLLIAHLNKHYPRPFLHHIKACLKIYKVVTHCQGYPLIRHRFKTLKVLCLRLTAASLTRILKEPERHSIHSYGVRLCQYL